jgi:Carboxypeptidase regulatory-like domain
MRCVWWGALMLAQWLRRMALFAALLLALCVLDSEDLERPMTAAAAPLEKSELSLHVVGADSVTVWTAQVLLKNASEQGRGSYLPVLEWQGKLGETKSARIFEGTYWLIIRANGYAREAIEVEFSADKRVEVELKAAHRLLVRVFAEKEEELIPLPEATVLVGESSELVHGAATNEQGEIAFTSLSKPPYRVRIFAPGYESYDAVTEADLVVRLRPVSTLNVTVLDGGIPVPDAEVVIAGVNLWPTRKVITGPRGRIEISGLKPGSYFLYATHGERISPIKRDVQVRPESGAVPVDLILGQGVFAEALVVSDEKSLPIANAQVTWSSAGLGQFSHHEVTAESGMARIGPLVERGGFLTVRAVGYVAEMVPVEAAVAGGPSWQTVRLKKAASISGRVVDDQGFPVAGATLEAVGNSTEGLPISVTYRSEAIADAHFDWASDWDRSPANVLIPVGELGVMLGPVPPIPLGAVQERSGQQLTSDETGHFHIEGVPAGEVIVLARHPDHLDGKSEVLRIAVGDHKTTEIVLGRGKRLRGRVVDHRGFPVELARIQVMGRGFERRVSAESDGTFELLAAPEEVTLRVSSLMDPLRILFAEQVDGKRRHEEILMELPEPRESSSFQVVDGKGEPVDLAQVHLVSLIGEVPLKQTKFTQAGGEVSFDEVRGLRARVQVKAPGYVERSVELTLSVSQKIKLEPAMRATGRITQARGRMAAPGAEVTIRSGAFVRTTRADDLGEYRFAGLPPGQVELSATHPELGMGRRKVMLKSASDDRPQELPDLDLAPAWEISGRVQTPDGEPVSGALIAADRLSPYLPVSGSQAVLGRSNEDGEFTISVERTAGLYLYGVIPGRAFGWSDEVPMTTSDRQSGVTILIDHKDVVLPNQLGTVLIGIEERAGRLIVFSVAEGTQAAGSGLRPEETILEIDGLKPRDVDEARELLSGLPGSDVRIVVSSSGSPVERLVPREGFLR